MAHIYDYQVCFSHLDVAFTAKKREASASETAPNQRYRRKSSTDPLEEFFDNALSGNPLGKLTSKLPYPGSWKRIQKVLSEHINSGRSKLAREHDAKRAKIATTDGNFIDTMYADQRTESEQGEILVVCCEGNCGFYEVGNMFTAVRAGFSALGWNAPGFCCSTGKPEPSQIRMAVDAVMQYAISVLGYPVSSILLLGYSIGGYPATWAATLYPTIRGLILDASFDQLLPLVMLHTKNKLSDLLSSILKEDYNLNICDLLRQYHGPVTIIRRSQDEIVGVNGENGYVNHTNILLKRFLSNRYPEIVNSSTSAVLDDWLGLYDSTQDLLLSHYVIKCPGCPSTLRSYLQDRADSSRRFPVTIGKSWDQSTREHLALHLAERHLRTCHGKHVTELPSYFLAVPWNPFR